MKVRVRKSKLSGNVVIPASKSLSHRAIIAACLSEGVSHISNILYSDDIIATLDAMEACGAKIERHEDSLTIVGGKIKRVCDVIDAHESGSTIRFMIPIAMVCDMPITFVGRSKLVKRPLDTYFEIFDKQGIKYEKGEDYLPLSVYGGLKPDTFYVPGNVSSQFITGLLFALPLLDGDSKIVLTSKLESRGYIDLTIDVLKKFGVYVSEVSDGYLIKGNQKYKACDYMVEGDFSQSAFWLVLDMLGHDVNLLGMDLNSLQGDKKILDDIVSFGGEYSFNDGILKAKRVENKGATISFSQSPDLGPVLSVLAALSNGESMFVEAARLRIKESDRITDVLTEINKLGGCVSEGSDYMHFNGVSSLKGGVVVSSHNDHRIAMALAVAGSVCEEEIVIDNAESINKSYPHFFKQFASLGGDITYEE